MFKSQKQKIGGVSAIKMSKLILYCSQLALSLHPLCMNHYYN